MLPIRRGLERVNDLHSEVEEKDGFGGGPTHTPQPIDSPLFELLEGNLGRWRESVEVQTMRVIRHLEGCTCKLLFLVVECAPSFGINPIIVLSNHGGQTRASIPTLDLFDGQRKTKVEALRACISRRYGEGRNTAQVFKLTRSETGARKRVRVGKSGMSCAHFKIRNTQLPRLEAD